MGKSIRSQGWCVGVGFPCSTISDGQTSGGGAPSGGVVESKIRFGQNLTRWNSERKSFLAPYDEVSKGAKFMLNQDQIEQWKRDGYVIVPDFSPDEVALMKEEMERMRVEGLGRNPVTQNDGETEDLDRINYQIIPLNNKSEIFRPSPWPPR